MGNECAMCIEKHVLLRKMFTNKLNMGFSLYELKWQRQSMEWKHTNSPVKIIVPVTTVSKEGHADSILRHERTHNY